MSHIKKYNRKSKLKRSKLRKSKLRKSKLRKSKLRKLRGGEYAYDPTILPYKNSEYYENLNYYYNPRNGYTYYHNLLNGHYYYQKSNNNYFYDLYDQPYYPIAPVPITKIYLPKSSLNKPMGVGDLRKKFNRSLGAYVNK